MYCILVMGIIYWWPLILNTRRSGQDPISISWILDTGRSGQYPVSINWILARSPGYIAHVIRRSKTAHQIVENLGKVFV